MPTFIIQDQYMVLQFRNKLRKKTGLKQKEAGKPM